MARKKAENEGLGKVTLADTGEIYTCWCCCAQYEYDSMYTWPKCGCLLTYCEMCKKCDKHCECEGKAT